MPTNKRSGLTLQESLEQDIQEDPLSPPLPPPRQRNRRTSAAPAAPTLPPSYLASVRPRPPAPLPPPFLVRDDPIPFTDPSGFFSGYRFCPFVRPTTFFGPGFLPPVVPRPWFPPSLALPAISPTRGLETAVVDTTTPSPTARPRRSEPTALSIPSAARIEQIINQELAESSSTPTREELDNDPRVIAFLERPEEEQLRLVARLISRVDEITPRLIERLPNGQLAWKRD